MPQIQVFPNSIRDIFSLFIDVSKIHQRFSF